MKKIFYYLLFFGLVIGLTTGCTDQKEKWNTLDKKENDKKEETKGKCKIEECLNSIEITNTVEDINSIIGFEGEKKDENSNKYYWNFSDTTKIEVSIGSSGNTITATIDRNKIANKKVDFSRYDEIKALLDSGTSLTYDEFVEKIGGVQGTLVSKSSSFKRYTWANSKGGYLSASFSERTGKCTIITGRF